MIRVNWTFWKRPSPIDRSALFWGMWLLFNLNGPVARGQLESGLALYPNIDSGGSAYFTTGAIQATPSALDVHGGLDFEFRTNPRTGFSFGFGIGHRSYYEVYDFLGVQTTLEHRVKELLLRAQVMHTLNDDQIDYWMLCYGLTFAQRGKSNVSIVDLADNSGTFDVTEPSTIGLRLGLIHGQKSWLRGLAQVGVMVDLHFVNTKEELYVPWLGRYSLEIGRSRCFAGLVFRYRIARMPWTK